MNSAETLERFRNCLEQLLGLVFPEGHHGLLTEVLRKRAGRRKLDDYLSELETSYDEEEISRLAAELTVGETLFFRHEKQLQTFIQWALPQRQKARQTLRRLSILSVGCSSGEEPYSLAMLLHQNFPVPDWKVQILGVDVNRKALAVARRGLYSSWSIRETPDHLLKRWFLPKGDQFLLDKNILELVQFEERNLNLPNSDLWLPGRWDVIFCRNMLMYFAPEKASRLVAHFARSLADGGFLFLGPAENLRGISQEFSVYYRDESFYYQLAPEPQPAISPLPLPVPRTRRPVATVSAPPRPGLNTELLRELLDNERYGQALELLERLPPSPELSLWKASVLVNSGKLEEAERVCQTLLHQPQSQAGAHLLLGMCRRELGELGAARAYFEQAARLDGQLALARVYLGMLLRRLGLAGLARTHLRQALTLLEKESEQRFLLFGGGYRRSAWQALCQSELERCPK
ncbi:MAG: tetratricopeptide repeat protein [Candidatus Eremiobacteraeota bacterium]|nr:tetratricopeptide repeat protein [Candidatus Eremiobacteraeota bacterium]MCW5869763.1 tetratricopeptide repeat protein [Candidatus Eremiobacteraeota bacterium]